jgi:hypothetical protein
LLVRELPTTLLKPYAKSRVNNHVQTIAFMQLVDSSAPTAALDLGLCENVVTSRRRSLGGNWTKFIDDAYGDHAAARAAFLRRVASEEASGYCCLTSTGIFLPMNNTDLKHFRANGMISRAALEYGSALFDNIARWYMASAARAGTRSPAAAPVASSSSSPATPPPPPPAVLSVSATGDFGEKLTELETVLGKIVGSGKPA